MSSVYATVSDCAAVKVYAGFWSRVAAKLVDLVIFALCLLPLDLLNGTSFVLGKNRGFGHEGVGEALVFVSFCLYCAAMESSRWQATVGKRMAGIIVTDVDGNRISFRRALARSISQITGIFGIFVMLFSARKQALHDYIAETVAQPGTL
ncbi:MAG TPA: RDD family protein [Terriglobales bacterium]|nr:RDD family protein [Terriglobales bacterium]